MCASSCFVYPEMQEGSDFWHAATSLALLTDALYEKWVLEPERLREAESMREAGLGAALVEAGVDSQLNTARYQPCYHREGGGRYAWNWRSCPISDEK